MDGGYLPVLAFSSLSLASAWGSCPFPMMEEEVSHGKELQSVAQANRKY
jgi:hypothetical protein